MKMKMKMKDGKKCNYELNLTHAWWYTLWPVWPTANDTPLIPLGIVR